MSKTVAILTDFGSHDCAYSLCAVASNQAKMLKMGGYKCKIFVRKGFKPNPDAYPNAELVYLDHGRVGNTISITGRTDTEIDSLTNQMRSALADVDVVLTHDLIFQPTLFNAHIAARRIAKERSNLHWLHWVHSAGKIDIRARHFRKELMGQFPNSKLVVFHDEEAMRKRSLFDYEMNQTVTIPNPIDFTEDYHPAAKMAIDVGGLWDADVIAVYPCRLDRGKQPHIILEIFTEMLNYDARVVIVDFHSTAGDKDTYRKEMVEYAKQNGLPVLFTSTLEYPEANYHIPHKAVMDLLNFGDILIHPSRSESDPLILPEAAWARCGLVLNFDLPLFHQWENRALLYKFSSNVDMLTGMVGETTTEYGSREAYMKHVAGGIAFIMGNNPVLLNHRRMRKERSLKSVWEKALWGAIEGV